MRYGEAEIMFFMSSIYSLGREGVETGLSLTAVLKSVRRIRLGALWSVGLDIVVALGDLSSTSLFSFS